MHFGTVYFVKGPMEMHTSFDAVIWRKVGIVSVLPTFKTVTTGKDND